MSIQTTKSPPNQSAWPPSRRTYSAGYAERELRRRVAAVADLRQREPGLAQLRRLARANLRCKTRSYLRPNFSANCTDFRQLERARSRLYRSRFLQPNTHFAAFFEIYKMCTPLPLSNLKISAKFRQTCFANFEFLANLDRI